MLLLLQPPDVASGAIDAFHSAARAMQGTVMGYSKALFVSLALIGGCWDALVLAGERADITTWGVSFLRRVLWFLTFWVLMIYGPQWTTWIVQSLQLIGSNASGVSSVSPGSIMAAGADVSGQLLAGSAQYGFTSGQFTVGLTLVIAAILIRISFLLIAVQVAMLLVLWYVVGSLGVIFLGFGGSRWTAPYTERYFSMAVSIGVKFLTIMFVVGIGMQFGPLLLQMAQSAPSSPNPGGVALEIVGASGLLALICWQVPKIFATLMGGSPAFGGGEFWSGVSAVVSGGLAAAGVAAAGVAAASAAGGAIAGSGAAEGGGSAGGASSVGSVSSAGASRVAPAGGVSSSGGSGGGGSSSGSGGGSTGGGGGGGSNGGSSAGSHTSRAAHHAQRAIQSLGSDGGGHPPPPPSINV